jgi:hypothetical protein
MAVLGWPKTLTWTMFGTPVSAVPSSYTGSDTDCHIEIDINPTAGGSVQVSPGGDYRLKDIKVEVKLIATDTWVLAGVPTATNQAAVLQHEQGHYNIAGITARDIDTALTALRNPDPKALAAAAVTTANGIRAAGQKKEDKYDDKAVNGGTDGGNDPTQQAAWNSKIAAATSLASLP